ncbi:MAG TPA: patatin-like phospholipase family protein [bacterium]|nr:patatin-like phospholipase family protein [bacterium]HPG46504.1 patatin-like phospholipase family protein [bacterium]HPM98439.1 patatin-like phospholipase family protein [bacterium]
MSTKNMTLSFRLKNRIRGSRLEIHCILLFFLLSAQLFALESEQENRPTVGLVLSGGGAKGFAHVGVIKTLDSLQIPIDYIAGTSMGGIIGALHAVGYSGVELEKIAHQTDWLEIFSDMPSRRTMPFLQKRDVGRYQVEFGLQGLLPQPRSGLIFGQKIALLFNSLTFPFERTNRFDDLPIPFRCVAVDLVTGNEVVLDSGSLALAMRATMSIPTVFSPVEWGDSLLVDGGLLNNLPVDVIKAMGADIVIAVDVASDLKPREKLNSGFVVLQQTLAIFDRIRWAQNRDQSDLYIHPDLADFTVADFNAEKIERMMKLGEEAAQSKIPELLELQRRHNLYRAESKNERLQISSAAVVQSIAVNGNTSIPADLILQNLAIAPGDTFSTAALSDAVAALKAGGQFSAVHYELTPVDENGIKISLYVREVESPQIYGISISGNQSLPFSFIYRLIGLSPGERLNVQELNARLMEVYALGYFETLLYEISPIDTNRINMHFFVKELPIRRLRMGIRYDDHHKLVGSIGLLGTNIFLPGLRMESDLQFAGLTRISTRISYPSRYMAWPVYPYLHSQFKELPTYLYDLGGNKIVRYGDRSLQAGIGLAIQVGRGVNGEAEIRQEWMDIKTAIGLDDPSLLGLRKARLRQFHAQVVCDNLDDTWNPRDGLLLTAVHEQSWKKLGSDLAYRFSSASFDIYRTLGRRHTWHFGLLVGNGKNQPVYKFFNLGHPSYFLGTDYDQLLARSVSLVRLDYKVRVRPNIFITLTGNTCPAMTSSLRGYEYRSHWVNGIGLSLKLISPVGPIDLYVARGEASPFSPGRKQNKFFLTIGHRF